jgi:hypothetical protein
MNYLEVLIYVSPELSQENRNKVRSSVLKCAGVVSAEFDPVRHPHVMVAHYNSSTVRYTKILQEAKGIDPAADLSPVCAWRRKHLHAYLKEPALATA